MHGITITINPVAFSIGSLDVAWHGIMSLLGIVAAVIIVRHEAKKKGIPENFIYDLAIWAVIGGIIGARLFHVMDSYDLYRGHFWQIFKVEQGGLAIWGGYIGGVLATIIYTRFFNKQNVSLSRLLDAAVPGLIVGLMIGRIGCTINGDATGHATSMPWGFIYVNPGAQRTVAASNLFKVPTHPYPIYEIAFNLCMLVLLLKVRKSITVNGMLFWIYAGLFSIARIWLTTYRQEPIVFVGLQEAQVVGIIVLVISVAAIAYLWRRKQAAVVPPLIESCGAEQGSTGTREKEA
jgi:phosphatidylglycerol:prolipoprotein diacylglycerol transferase